MKKNRQFRAVNKTQHKAVLQNGPHFFVPNVQTFEFLLSAVGLVEKERRKKKKEGTEKLTSRFVETYPKLEGSCLMGFLETSFASCEYICNRDISTPSSY